MDVMLKRDLTSRGYRRLDIDDGSEVYCKFAHSGQEFLGVKLCRETVYSEEDYYMIFLHLPQKSFFGRLKMLNRRIGNSWIDVSQEDMEWLNRRDIDALCELASECRLAATYEEVSLQLEAKLMEDKA